MRITGLESYTVAIPFIAPIFSAYGVSYLARIRTIPYDNHLLQERYHLKGSRQCARNRQTS